MTTRSRTRSLLVGSLVVPILLGLGSTPASASGVLPQRDTCLPVPGLPCLPDLPGTTPPTATTPTSVSGSPKVDLTLTATEPVWSDPSAVTTYQWQRDATDIADATGQTYVVQVADIGAKLTVVATGTVSVLASGTSTSDPVIGLIGDPPTPIRAPSITGDARAGGRLTAAPGTWSGMPTPTFDYQWYRRTAGSAAKISGADEMTYDLKTGDAGKRLAVLVTANRLGHQPGLAAATITIRKLTSSVTLTSSTKQIRAAQRGVVRVTIAAQGGTPTGVVRILEGEKLLARLRLPSSAHGTTQVTLPRLALGTHALVASYAGNGSIAASSSRKLVLTVVR